MSTPIVTARRNLVQRISNLLRKDEDAEINLIPWQIGGQRRSSNSKKSASPEGERTMSEAASPPL